MLTHLFKLIWNKKKQNFLLMLEIFLSFMGMCAAFTFMLYPYNNYKLPRGFLPDNVWVVNFNAPDDIKNMDSLQVFRESVKQVLLSMKGIEDVSYSSSNIPFSGNSSNTDISYNGHQVWANVYTTEDSYANVLGAKVLEGRWFTKEDNASADRPVVINEGLKKKLFQNESALGKLLTSDASDRMKIIGVVTTFKDESEFEVPPPGLFRRMDTSEMRYYNWLLIKVKPGADAAFENRVYKTLSNLKKNATIEIEHLADMMEARNKMMLIPFLIFITIAGFLVINVALGIFGVFWFSIHKRRGEIGLRRAVGATGQRISWQLMAEAILIATLSILIGTLFAIQFPLLNLLELPAENYITAIIYSTIFIYVLVILCAWYPGKQAAGIYPATALHEE
ncbi:MAG TPA: ABC transporter permease [Chitinophagaceae bacterium]|nr:ABC transporter permease [Chitinophagaceae bacterium]